jgi:uncharacterized membrane protein
MAVFLGVCVAACFGSGDFLGGVASRRMSTITVLLFAQTCALVLAALYAASFSGEATARDLGFGAGAGALNVVALGLLYHGLATGRMGVVAPVTAVVSSTIPVVYGVAAGERPSGVSIAGVACAIVAGGLIARERDEKVAVHPLQELGLAVCAGIGFGISFVLYSETGEDSGFWPALGGRAAAVPLVIAAVLATRSNLRVAPADRRMAIVAGALDITATALLLLAVREGLRSLVAPLAALGPAFTVALAWIVLKEPMARLQLAGLVLAFVGLTLIAGG